MSKKLKFLAMMLLCTLLSVNQVWGQASVGTTLFSESFDDFSANDTPSAPGASTTLYGSPTITYTCTNGTGTKPGSTKVCEEGLTNSGSSPELMVGKKGDGSGAAGGSFSISGIPNGGATKVTVAYTTNKNTIQVSVSGTGYSGGTTTTTKDDHSFDVTIASNAASTFTLTFTATTTSNVRLDDISVTVKTAGTPSGYTLGYSVSPTGKADVTLGSTSLAEDATTTATYSNVATGYEFLYWSISGTGATLSSADGFGHSTANPVTVTMGTENATVTANLQCSTPSIDTQPSDGSCVQNGTPTALSVVATGATGYQWQKCATSNGTFTDVTENTDGTGSQTGSFSPVTSSIGTMYYKCVVKNTGSDCNTSRTSNVVSFEVTAPTPATITLVNYSGDATTTGYYSGGSFTLPDENDFTCGELTFVGWSTVPITTPSPTKPNSNYYEKGASVTLGASNTFYAVFAEESSGGSGEPTTVAGEVTTSSPFISGTGWSTTATDYYTGPYLKINTDGMEAAYVAPEGNTISRFQYTYKLQSSTSCTGHSPYAGWIGGIDFYVSTDGGSNYSKLNAKSLSLDVGSGWSDVAMDFDDLSSGNYNAAKVVFAKTCGNLALKGFSVTYSAPAKTYSNYTTNCVNMIPVYLDAYHFGDTDGAKFAIYSWKNGSDPLDDKLADAFMTKVTDCYYGHLYEGEMPDNHDRVIFLRNAEAASVPVKSGANKLNQTSNITTEANKDFFTIASGGGGDSYTGSWSVYTPNYAVTFNKNGVTTTNTWPVDQCKASGTAATNPNVTPLTMGKTFVGWYREAGGTNAWNFSNTITQDTILYAKWNDVATKTIYLDASATLSGSKTWDADNVVLFAHAYINGTSLATDIKAISPISSCQQHVYQFVIPGNADYVTFARCATGTTTIIWEGGSSNVYNQFSQPVQANKDLYTVTEWYAGSLQNSTFTPTSYTISFAAGDYGSGDAPANDSKACGVAFTLPSTQVFSRNGYTMDGWSINANGSTNDYNLGGSYTTEANQTFYPHWALASYDITLNTNGGTINSGNVTTYVYGTGATLPTDVTKSHATFQGWYATSNFSGEQVYSISTTEYGAKEYWAKWEDVTWTVTWKANGSTQTTSVVDGNTATTPTPNPANLATSPDGCVAEFVGWVIEANDPGPFSVDPPSSAPSGMFTTTSPAITGDVTFVAVYRQEQ